MATANELNKTEFEPDAETLCTLEQAEEPNRATKHQVKKCTALAIVVTLACIAVAAVVGVNQEKTRVRAIQLYQVRAPECRSLRALHFLGGRVVLL